MRKAKAKKTVQQVSEIVSPVVRTWVRNHRTIGYEVARAYTEDGKSLIILQTSDHKQEVAQESALLPATEKDLINDVSSLLIAAIFQARFLELDNDTLRATFERLLAVE